MALKTKWGFQNIENLGLVTNYALILEDPGHVQIENKTAPIDCPEALTFKGMFTQNPSSELSFKPKASVAGPEAYSQFLVKLDAVASTIDDTTNVVVEQNVVSAYLVVRAPRTAAISDADVRTIVDRLYQATKHDDGTDRIPDLRRLSLRPTTD